MYMKVDAYDVYKDSGRPSYRFHVNQKTVSSHGGTESYVRTVALLMDSQNPAKHL